MKYVALLSGGKDSCYNLVHCAKNGHELVAAASLGPELGKEELDSYLYQTVGQDAIEFVAQALEVPLYRQIISGSAVEQGAEYGARNGNQPGGINGDETEDLYTLLSTVKLRHPDVQGVSVGAILSNYQRVRVEHVCHRLSLTPLCYLWQMDQGALLVEMIDAPMEAILIKVAGIGLTTKHLGKTLAEMQPTLVKLNTLYGSHICGEGGEYESLTLDCPLFQHRIILDEVETVIHSDSDFATVAFLRIKSARLEPKTSAASIDDITPKLLDDTFEAARDVILSSQTDDMDDHEPLGLRPTSRRLDSWLAVAGVQRDLSFNDEMSIEEEVVQCFQKLQGQLAQHSLELSHCTNINIYLSSMDLFARVNAVYATYFSTSPPARACVAVDLPFPCRVRLDCIAYDETTASDRLALHVQGLSYWAPANIGPYSQAITVDERVFISGQIGLIPSNLTLPNPQSLAIETALAFQHPERVVDVLKNNSGGGWQGHIQGILYWLIDPRHVRHVAKAHQNHHSAPIPTLFLVVKHLPKDALVEKQVLLHTGRCMITDEDTGDCTLEPCAPHYEHGSLQMASQSTANWSISYFEETRASCAVIWLKDSGQHLDAAHLKLQPNLKNLWDRCLSVRLFYNIGSALPTITALVEDLFTPKDLPAITWVPCRQISTGEHVRWDYALFIIAS